MACWGRAFAIALTIPGYDCVCGCGAPLYVCSHDVGGAECVGDGGVSELSAGGAVSCAFVVASLCSVRGRGTRGARRLFGHFEMVAQLLLRDGLCTLAACSPSRPQKLHASAAAASCLSGTCWLASALPWARCSACEGFLHHLADTYPPREYKCRIHRDTTSTGYM